MLRWTLKSLVSDPWGLAASLAATACAYLLVVIFQAMFAGEAEQIVAYVRNAKADVWVMQRDVSNMHMATSYMQDWKAKQVEMVEGVERVDSILYLYTVVEAAGKPWFAFIVGLESSAELAGPWATAAGKKLPAPGEAVVPSVFAEVYDAGLGQDLSITDHSFVVVGLSEGTFSMANSVIFVHKNDLEDVMSSLDIVSYILVETASGESARLVAERIEREVEGVNALTHEEFLANDKALAMQMGVDVIAMMTLVTGGLATLLVGFTIYSHTERRRKELAVARAIGVGNRALYLSAVVPALLLSLASAALAGIIASIVAPLVSALVPMITLEVSFVSVLRIGAVGVVVAVVASLIPARRLVKIDPVSAFQA